MFAVGVFDLIDAFRRLMQNESVEHFMDITLNRISLSERIDQILSRLSPGESVSFSSLFPPESFRQEMILTFVALLEIIRLGLVTAWQASTESEIRLCLK